LDQVKHKKSAQVDRLKAEKKKKKAHFEAMFGARTSYFYESTSIMLF